MAGPVEDPGPGDPGDLGEWFLDETGLIRGRDITALTRLLLARGEGLYLGVAICRQPPAGLELSAGTSSADVPPGSASRWLQVLAHLPPTAGQPEADWRRC